VEREESELLMFKAKANNISSTLFKSLPSASALVVNDISNTPIDWSTHKSSRDTESLPN